MTVLDNIILRKKAEVQEAKKRLPENQLREMPGFGKECRSLNASLNDPSRTGIIAEFKRASPSKGVINDRSGVTEVVQGYEAAGASAVSVLTDRDFFHGSLDDLAEASSCLKIPLLRKEFIIDAYQVTEAKAYGADVILLIAAALPSAQIRELSEYARDLGLSVLLEVHDEEELRPNLFESIDAIGVNNRNLHDFSVSIKHSLELAPQIPDRYAKVSESGISDPATVRMLRDAGFRGFLIGENFMKTDDPVAAIQSFTKGLG